MLRDLFGELVWPRVLTGALYGLRPGRLGLAFFALVTAALLLSLGTWLDDMLLDREAVWIWPIAGGVADWARIPWSVFVAWPVHLVSTWPITTLVCGPLLVGLLVVTIAAISRLAAVEIASGRQLSWWEGLGFAARAWRSLLGAVLGPWLAVWFIALGIAGFGFLLLRWPWLNILGAILFPIALLLSLAAAVIALVYVLGRGLLIPAVVCDGSDAIDAVQRTYAYVLDRPLRLVIYILLATLGVVVAVLIAALLVFATVWFAASASGVWAGADGRGMIDWATGSAMGILGPDSRPDSSYGIAGAVLRFWILIPLMAIPATYVSCVAAAFTMVYLAMRRACDGQEIEEVWSPGKVEEAMAASMAARVKAGGTPASGADLTQADYE